MTPIAPHITAFLQQRLPLERGASDNTCESYAYAFKLLFEYAAAKLKKPPSALQFEQIDAALVLGFLNHLEMVRHNGPNSRNTRLAAIKSFMHFMEYRVPAAMEQITRILAIPAKRTDTRLVRHLTIEEMQAILDSPDPARRDGIRDRAMLHLCFAAGLRVSELVGLQLQDMKLQPHASILVHGKGRKERCLPLWKETATALRAWLVVRGTVMTPDLFLNARGEAMTRSGFEYICTSMPGRRNVVPVAIHKADIPACVEAYLRPHGPAGDQGLEKGVALAWPRPHANDRNIYARGPVGEIGSPGSNRRPRPPLRPIQGHGHTHRLAKTRIPYAETKVAKLTQMRGQSNGTPHNDMPCIRTGLQLTAGARPRTAQL
jgi:site-specific recombinase XerD